MLQKKGYPNFVHETKHFEVWVLEYTGITYYIGMNEGYASFIAEMLPKMRTLRSFKYISIP